LKSNGISSESFGSRSRVSLPCAPRERDPAIRRPNRTNAVSHAVQHLPVEVRHGLYDLPVEVCHEVYHWPVEVCHQVYRGRGVPRSSCAGIS